MTAGTGLGAVVKELLLGVCLVGGGGIEKNFVVYVCCQLSRKLILPGPSK